MKRIILAVMFLFFFSSFLSLNAQWAKTYGGEGSEDGNSIQQTVDGGYIVAGSASSFGAGGGVFGDIWVLKLSSEGDIEWQKTYGGIEDDSAASIQPTIDRGYIVAGWTNSFGAGEDDIWVLKLSSDGNIEWQKNYGSGGANSIQQTIDGGYIVAGWINNFPADYDDIWVLKLSSEGDIEWQKTYGGSEDDSARSIQPTIDGGYIVAGSTSSFGVGPECWVLKLSSVGDIEWQKSYGGNYSPDSASSIQQTNDEGYIVAGRTGSWGAGGEIWVLKLLQNGDINPRCAFIRSSNAEVSDTNIIPLNLDIVPEDTNISPQDTDIFPQDSDANVYTLCVSDICTLTLSVRGPGTTDPEPGTYIYYTGARITIRAIPDSECDFIAWRGNVMYGVNPITITMDGDKQITAEFYKPGPGGGEGITSSLGLGGCFIATTAYGSPLHLYVKILRDFRDKYLMPSKLGRSLVNIYYKYSPSVADFIMKHKVLKAAVRFSLLPVIVLSYSMLHFGPIITAVMIVFFFMFPVFLILFFKRKLRRVEPKDPKALTS